MRGGGIRAAAEPGIARGRHRACAGGRAPLPSGSAGILPSVFSKLREGEEKKKN